MIYFYKAREAAVEEYIGASNPTNHVLFLELGVEHTDVCTILCMSYIFQNTFFKRGGADKVGQW